MLNHDQEQAYRTALDSAVYFDLSAYGKIEVAGPDAASFLHYVSTNDIKNLPVGGGCEAFLCNARARTLAHIFVSRWELVGRASQPVPAAAADNPGKPPPPDIRLMLDMVPMLGEKVYQHLNKYLISEQVELTNRTPELALLRLVGPRAKNVLEEALGTTLPALPLLHFLSRDDSPVGACHIRAQQVLGLPGFDVFCPIDQLSHFKDRLSTLKVEPAPLEVHEVLRIEAGLPEYGKDMDDDRFVMEVGRTAQAICYTKGCYLGQEPIVMARDRGQVNRTFMGIKIADASKVCAPGSKLFQGETEVGQVTSATWSPRLQQIIALAYLRRGIQEPGQVLVLDPKSDGRKAVVTSLPFVS